MNKKVSCVLMLLSLRLFACANSPQDTFIYDELYNSDMKKYDEIDYENLSASYGYSLNDQQGYNSWFYFINDNLCSYDTKNRLFGDKNNYLKDDKIHLEKNNNASRKFIVQKEGKAKIYGNLINIYGKGTLVIYLNQQEIYHLSFEKDESPYFEVSTQLKKNDELKFTLIANEKLEVSFNPSVSYRGNNDSLYHKTPFGKSYGDVFPYYDEEQELLYMFYLWTDDARKNDYKYALDISSDMLTYENIPEENNYDIWKYYKTHGNLAQINDCSRYIDNEKYSFGIRDHALIFDQENKRYLLIAGCYYEFNATKQISDLVIYESNDEIGYDWNKQGNVVHSNYVKNLPECPSMIKINKRWYAFTSVAYNTVHQVGPLQYWMGDENQDIMDIDFSSKQFQFLDGEDLCAARVFNVKDKVYMFGWIPNTYDTMPWSPWGGYLNLPRQVVQHEDGTLGGRMDSGLKKKLNFGNVFSGDTFDVNNETKQITGNLNRNIIRFHANVERAHEISYVLKQGSNEYRVSIVKENNSACLKVTSPNDPKHVLNSFINIPLKDEYEFYIVNDGEFLEIFVDDEYALTAHTSMKNEPYDASFDADGQAKITNIKIDKLIPYWNLF